MKESNGMIFLIIHWLQTKTMSKSMPLLNKSDLKVERQKCTKYSIQVYFKKQKIIEDITDESDSEYESESELIFQSDLKDSVKQSDYAEEVKEFIIVEHKEGTPDVKIRSWRRFIISKKIINHYLQIQK